jgi:hypothetical protein
MLPRPFATTKETTMEEMIQQLVQKVGLDEEKAAQVVEFLKENAAKIPEWLGGSDMLESLKDKLPGGLGKLF